jgi:hypothetical protein
MGMFVIHELDNYELSDRWYSGNAGRKEGVIIADGYWLVKFPKRSNSAGDRMRSYSNSPIGEYLGSRIYESLGIPVHTTILGIRESKLVVACKDFRKDGDELVEFKEITIRYPHAESYDFDQGSGNGTVLDDVLNTVSNAYPLDNLPNVIERFWDMFVTDYFIGNNDRNNTNWGLIKRLDGSYELAPVYDNGRAFMEAQLLDYLDVTTFDSPEMIKSYQCNFLDNSGNYLKPHEVLTSENYPAATAAAKRFARRFDRETVFSLIDNVPCKYENIPVLSEAEKELFKKVLDARLSLTIVPVAQRTERDVPVGAR